MLNNNTTFFCIYSGQEYSESLRTLEHIVPYAIGGSGGFGTRDVSSQANSEIGRIADAPLVNHYLITFQRWRLQIAAQSGQIPGISYCGTVEINGSPVKARYDIRPDGSGELTTIPTVHSDWTNGQFHVQCDPAKLPAILESIIGKSLRKGMPIEFDDLRIQSSEQVRIERPKLTAELSVGLSDMSPGFVKMALGTGHFVFGQAWSRSADADLLRKFIGEPDSNVRSTIPIKGQVWPNIIKNDVTKPTWYVDDDKHVLVLVNQRPVVFHALLFGRIDGWIQLAERPIDGSMVPPGKGKVFVICCKTRQLVTYDWHDFLANQMIAKGHL